MPEADTKPDVDETPRRLELSTTQITASALAAVSAAVFASWFGTAGTLIGAALGSIVATVGSATYSYSLDRTAEIARRTALQVKESGVVRPGRTREAAVVEEPREAWWRRLDPRGVDLPWGKIAAASAAVMLVAMVAITSFEGLAGRSVASLTGSDEPRSTTVGNVFGSGDGSQPEQEPTAPDPSSEPTPSEEASPSDGATTEPTEEPSSSPSATPTEDATDAPVPTPTPTGPSIGSSAVPTP